MFRGHPRGLYVAFFANMGERFGFYTMMAILTLFLQAKYGLDTDKTGLIYSAFYAGIYFLSLLGGVIADATKRLMYTILIGLIVMFIGYVLMSIPIMDKTTGLIVSLVALGIIAFGNGLFKGNLQALVGNLYEPKEYRDLRDRAFNIFYMGINIGAFFAPTAATAIRNWWLKSHGFGYDANLPQMCHEYLDTGTVKDMALFQQLADQVSGHHVTDLAAFAQSYINVFSYGYHLAFAIAAVSMVISTVIYLVFWRDLVPGDVYLSKKEGKANNILEEEISPEETRKRLLALGLVFVVVIFFWMAFHQNGLTLTFFARDYVRETVPKFSYLFFDLRTFLPIIFSIFALYYLIFYQDSVLKKLKSGVSIDELSKEEKRTIKYSDVNQEIARRKKNLIWLKVISAVVIIISALIVKKFYNVFDDTMQIEPEKFLHFNPIFIVFLTPVIVGIFTWLAKKGKEPSTPKKIAIGMFLASLAYLILVIASINLPAPKEIGTEGSPVRVSEMWLISSYFIITIAELFLSPMGISFVSKVAPPKLKGSMQGAWLAATGVGNLLLFVGAYLWERVELWMVWATFVGITTLSGLFIVSILKFLEQVSENSEK